MLSIARESIPVTRSMLPPFERYVEELRGIWDSHWLTNAGPKVRSFEESLQALLETPQVMTFVNGGAALIAAIAAMDLKGEVITTPFTFPGTTHALALNGLTPVFCDIDPVTMNLDPAAVEAAITPQTSAILGVHVFGNPCAVGELELIAQRHGLKLIYDGAHAFGVKINGRNIASYGDAQMFSFNATKLLTTGEGGCVTYRDPALQPTLRRLRRWGMLEEGDVTMPGFNGMMTEMQAALGICNLEGLSEERRLRSEVVRHYSKRLSQIPGITPPGVLPGVEPALSYYVIRVKPEYGRTRDALLAELREHQILARRYFYPLISRLPCYEHLPSAKKGLTPVAEIVANEVISLPIYGELGASGVDTVCDVIESFASGA